MLLQLQFFELLQYDTNYPFKPITNRYFLKMLNKDVFQLFLYSEQTVRNYYVFISFLDIYQYIYFASEN